MIVLAGASASGKTEVAKYLSAHYQISKIITTTTRSPRNNEVNGVDYHFVSKEKFEEMIKNDEFVEYTIYNGNYYGSTKKEVAPNKCVVVDLKGLQAYKNIHTERIVTFFLKCSEDVRYERMLVRGDDENKAKNRILNDKDLFNKDFGDEVDYIIDSEHFSIEEIAERINKIYRNL